MSWQEYNPVYLLVEVIHSGNGKLMDWKEIARDESKLLMESTRDNYRSEYALEIWEQKAQFGEGYYE